MRVLGVDPGLSRCGVGVVDGPSRRPVAIRAGVIRTSPDDPVAKRLFELHTELTQLVGDMSPDAIAVERVFFNNNVRTAMGVGQAAGIVLLIAAQAGIPVVEYTPTQVKAGVAGTGDADKEQVAFMVRTLLRLPEVPRPADAADALALALCHLQAGGDLPGGGEMSPRLAAALAAAGPGAQIVEGRR
jgi:crossover junction endodeoxyribonuclease RuvC